MSSRVFSPHWFEGFAELIVSPKAGSVEGGEESFASYPTYVMKTAFKPPLFDALKRTG